MTLHLQIVGYNHRRYLQECLRSCLRQTVAFPVLYVDNASSDGSAEFVQRAFPQVRVVTNRKNLGYSGGQNEGLKVVRDTEIAVVLNPDVQLAPDFVEKGLAAFQAERVGAVVPLLFRAGEEDVIDAYGDILLLSLRAVSQYAGRAYSQLAARGSPLNPPWGFTGAAAFLRRTALYDVALKGEIFDEDLFAYREDVDLSWRLRHRGWEIVGAPAARATHVRATRSGTAKDSLVLQLSWRNYFLVLVKNVPAKVLFRHCPWILLEAFARILQMLVTPRLWAALPEFRRLLPRFVRKRSDVLFKDRHP